MNSGLVESDSVGFDLDNGNYRAHYLIGKTSLGVTLEGEDVCEEII